MDSQRAAILTAAVEVLAEHGYGGCSVAAIAARAGVATGSVYRHFPNKAELDAELFRLVVEREVAAVTVAAARPGTSAERIAAFVETFAGRALKSPTLAYALLAEPVNETVDAQRLVFRRAFSDVIASVVEQGVAGGALPAQNSRLTAAALVGAVGEALVGPLAAGAEEPDTIPSLITFAVRALGGRDATDA